MPNLPNDQDQGDENLSGGMVITVILLRTHRARQSSHGVLLQSHIVVAGSQQMAKSVGRAGNCC
eukprot:6474874-Amphidinium_carterae.4